jgi:hypothetical protein
MIPPDDPVLCRREFLIGLMPVVLLPGMRAFEKGFSSVSTFANPDHELLKSAMDEIIPAGDGMPSASMVGGLQYLEYLGWQYPAIQTEISQFLKILEQASSVTFREIFSKLQPDQRVQILATLEKTEPTKFLSFVDYVYESYYGSPKVLGLISCSSSPSSIEDDEPLLAPVRKLVHLYREVP